MAPVIPVQIKRLPHGQDLSLPSSHSEGAAGMDLPAAVAEPTVLRPGEIRRIPCGFAIALPAGYEAQIRPRSGLATAGISIPNAPGTIDADYRGEIQVVLVNLGQEPFTVHRQMRIAQMLVKPVYRARWEEVTELPDSRRGTGRFGHTGH